MWISVRNELGGRWLAPFECAKLKGCPSQFGFARTLQQRPVQMKVPFVDTIRIDPAEMTEVKFENFDDNPAALPAAEAEVAITAHQDALKERLRKGSSAGFPAHTARSSPVG